MAPPPRPPHIRVVFPLRILWFAAWYLPITIYHLIVTGQYSTLFDVEALKSAWFARFWANFGPLSRENAAHKIKPLLEKNAHGVCLDIGPGTGQWLYLFAQALNPSITKIYGVEPNTALHAELRASAVRAGLGDIYEIIGCGAQDLIKKSELQPASVDTIITVQCLCSIPEPETNIRALYPLLKPGGRWLVYEHVRTKYQEYPIATWQRTLNIVWPHFIGGCEITRPTDLWLIDAGEWSEVALKPGPGEDQYDTIPHMLGYLKR